MEKEKQSLPARLVKPFLVSILIVAIYLGYLITVGMPKTQARNLYNQAEDEIRHGDIMRGYSLLEEAFAAFPEEYIFSEIQRLDTLLAEE